WGSDGESVHELAVRYARLSSLPGRTYRHAAGTAPPSASSRERSIPASVSIFIKIYEALSRRVRPEPKASAAPYYGSSFVSSGTALKRSPTTHTLHTGKLGPL